MRRMYNTAADARTTDCLEQTRRLHKGITDIAKRLDEQKSRALTITDLFTPLGETLRAKLKDYCVRLITKDPVGYARKTEELLWRKAFYDIVCASKKLRKGNTWTDAEKAMLCVHLAVGVGFYHHLILKVQLEYNLDLVGTIDFAFMQSETGSSNAKSKVNQLKHHNEEVKQCVIRLIHRSLVCLGDLARYKLELDPYWDPMIANRYYKMAIAIDPNIGMPHNQLGTVAGNKNYGLDAVYHYIRCVLCTEPFEGAEGNLKRAIVTHSICTDEKCLTQMCVCRLFSLLQLWDYDVPNSDRINQECQDLLTNIETCLSIEQSESGDTNCNEKECSIEVYLQNCKNVHTNYLTDDMIFKIVAICLMSISRLKTKESSEVQGVVAITLAILSQLMQFTITKLQESFIDLPLPNIELTINKKENKCNIESINIEDKDNVKQLNLDENNKSISLNDNKMSEKENAEDNDVHNGTRKTRDKPKSLLTKLRRRKRKNSSESDASDGDHTTMESSSDEINSDVSETEDDILSEENVLSEDALSEDITDDEGTRVQINKETAENSETEKLNGHLEPKTKSGISNTVNDFVQNGEQTSDDQIDKKLSDKDSVTNSGSTVTINSNNILEENSESSDRVTYIAQLKKQNLKPNEVLNILIGKEVLASIKICCDWLRSNPDIIRICGKSSRTLLKRVTVLLNLININVDALFKNFKDDSMILSSIDKLKECAKIIPLPEDIDLRGLNLLEDSHKSLNWNILHKHKMNKREETLLRVLKLIEFGHFLSSVEDAGVKYEQAKQLFVTVDLNACNSAKSNSKDWEMDHSRGKLMRHMGKLWLKAEVVALETRLTSRLMSPYLVPDHEALSKHTPTLKRLVYAKKFIVVIPSVVVSALDEVKRISGRAREATRWLEAQLKRGSRFLRAQRPHERLALPFIKGPRPKDKEAWLFFQIIECCHYLTQQTKVGITNDSETPVVTLLTGCNPDDKKVLSFSPEGLAKSAGVNIEYIESFHTKWKASSKSHG
ncbi:smg5 nonsense mediated mRNA decay factor [Megachile rotundata]|uniref:smg5 nonsense mediated mRNA decay factor n=1 Tax=Megachile rotundata TaxID=143995 RepID=UPI000258E352|nr:PREDICTED: protein SMG5 [Megachile rotundata]